MQNPIPVTRTIATTVEVTDKPTIRPRFMLLEESAVGLNVLGIDDSREGVVVCEGDEGNEGNEEGDKGNEGDKGKEGEGEGEELRFHIRFKLNEISSGPGFVTAKQ